MKKPPCFSQGGFFIVFARCAAIGKCADANYFFFRAIPAYAVISPAVDES